MAERPAKPARRRIVPEQIISPSKSQSETDVLQSNTPLQLELGDLKEHSEVAASLLGPGRKIFVDLAAYQKDEKAVDWKQLLRDRGVKPDKRAPAAQADGAAPNGSFSGIPPGRGGGVASSLAIVIQSLERKIGVTNMGAGGEDDESDDEPLPPIGVVCASSDSEGDDGDAADGKEQPEGGASGAATAGGASKSGKREGHNEYDYQDEFIDDSEFVQMIEHADRRKLKYSGFFIARGTIDRTEELVPEAVPDKPARKRKTDTAAAGGGDAAAGAAAAGGPGGDDQQPKKKHKKKTGAGAGGEDSAGPSAQAAGVTPVSASGKAAAVPYEMPADVVEAIRDLRCLAESTPHPPPPPVNATEAETKAHHRKALPPVLLERLKSIEHVFHRDYAQFKQSASRRILDELMAFMAPFSTRENLRLYVCPRVRKKKPAKEAQPDAAVTPDALRTLLAQSVPPPPPPEPQPQSDDDFVQQQKAAQPGVMVLNMVKPKAPNKWKAVPVTARHQVFSFMRQRMDKSLSTVTDELAWLTTNPLGQALMQETLGMFPAGSIDPSDLTTIFKKERQRAVQAAAKAAAAAAAVAEQESTPSAAATPVKQQQQLQQPSAPPVAFVPAQSLAAMAKAAAAQAAAAAQQKQQQYAEVTPVAAPVLAPAPSPAVQVQEVQQEVQQAAAPVAPIVLGLGPPDEELVGAGVAHGGDESTLRQLLTQTHDAKGSMYMRVVLRLLAAAGPSGLGVTDMAGLAVERGMMSWDVGSTSVRSGLSRQTKHEAVAMLHGYKYALKCFPGVVDTRAIKKAGSKDGSVDGDAPAS